MMLKIGLIINPIAGMGGRVGLKGTDGMVEEAIRLGAFPQAPDKAARALGEVNDLKEKLLVITGSGELGERIATELGFHVEIVHHPLQEGATKAEDTVILARKVADAGVALILFAGGDGTARDIVKAGELGMPVIGVPAGVKIHSPVFATHPESAGVLAGRYLAGAIKRTKETEVLDISEADYREGIVSTALYGYLRTPYDSRLMQNRKAPSPQSEENTQREIAMEIVARMVPDVAYFIGPGSTTREVMKMLGLSNTLLGIDVVLNKQLIHEDATESVLLAMSETNRCKLILTPTGGQGFLLGRGNQQASPNVLNRIGPENMIVVATANKLAELGQRPLLVDTGDVDTDHRFNGYVKVITGFQTAVICKVGDAKNH